jgi:hypothetical protein
MNPLWVAIYQSDLEFKNKQDEKPEKQQKKEETVSASQPPIASNPSRNPPRLTHKVGANLQRLIPPHDHPDLAPTPILQELNIPRSPLLPLDGGLVEPEELGSDFVQDVFVLFGGDDGDLFGELDDGFVVGVVFLGLRT